MIRTDYEKNLGQYVKNADVSKLNAIKKACGIALRGLDAQYVSMTDPAEIARIASGFASKHLGLSVAATKKGLKIVDKMMKAERSKMRTTVYYLLAKQTGTLGKLGGATKAKKAVKAKVAKATKKKAKKAKPAKKAKKAVKKKAKKAKRK